MKGIYISNYNLFDSTSGVSKKINMQIDAFKKNNVCIDAPIVFEKNKLVKIVTKLPFLSTVYDFHVREIIRSIGDNKPDFVYFRHNVFTRQLLKNLLALKKKGVLILYEIPTYPYDRNEKKIKNVFMRKKDRKWREKCGKVIDYIVDTSGSQEIFGAKTINISNGINPDYIIPKRIFKGTKEIHLIGVALMAPVHGFDRVIKSISNYYDDRPEKKVYFHVVGDGDARKDLEELTNHLNMEKYVFFYGKKYGDDLDEIYDKADIGIGTLAIQRRYANQKVSSLKTKEYSAKGIPFVTGEVDEIFEKSECDFQYKINQGDNPFDINKIITWYTSLVSKYDGKDKLADHIRGYSYKYLTWNDQIAKVVAVVSKKDN